jgi:hypothetical protein
MKLIPDDSWAILTIWQEARGESFAGKVGVAEVIRNRTEAKFRSDGSYASTCLWPLQFSGWNARDPNRIPAAKLDGGSHIVQDCIRAWTEALSGSDTVKGAKFYYNPSISSPDWGVGETILATIGNHRFIIPKS